MLKPKLLILPCKVKEYSHDPGYDVLVYANVYLEQRIANEPLADFALGIREVEIYRVSRFGENVIDKLTEQQLADLQTEMEAHANKQILNIE